MAPERSYPTLNLEQLKQLPIDSISHENTCLFMWFTNKYLTRIDELLKAWNYVYKDIAFVWCKHYANGKEVCGLGWLTRHSVEMCLFAYRKNRTLGIMKQRKNTNVKQILHAIKREHSRKPDICRKLVSDLLHHENKIELFARKYDDSKYFTGWEIWPQQIHEQACLPRKRKAADKAADKRKAAHPYNKCSK